MLILEGEAGKQIPESSRLEFQMQKTAPKDHLAGLCFLRTLLTICQKLRESSFKKVMHSFALLA